MLQFFLPCPWPIPYFAIFSWTRMKYSLNSNFCTATIESRVEFPMLLSHAHCEFLLAHINRTCQIVEYQCSTNARCNHPYTHKLKLTYKSEVPVRGLPGIEPPMIPIGLGDHFQFTPPPPMRVARSMNTDYVRTLDVAVGTPP